jgi:hypothetical protein
MTKTEFEVVVKTIRNDILKDYLKNRENDDCSRMIVIIHQLNKIILDTRLDQCNNSFTLVKHLKQEEMKCFIKTPYQKEKLK